MPWDVCSHNAHKCLMFGILLLELRELYDQVSASLSHFPLLLVIILACFVFFFFLQSGPKKEWRLVTLKTDVRTRYGLIGNLFLHNLGEQLVC